LALSVWTVKPVAIVAIKVAATAIVATILRRRREWALLSGARVAVAIPSYRMP